MKKIAPYILPTIAMLMVIFLAFRYSSLKKERKENPTKCSYYKNWAMKDIPARCIKYYQGN